MNLTTMFDAGPTRAAMALYCWPHRATHQLQVADVEVLVAALGAMVVDGYQLGDGDTRHAPDCLLDVIRLGYDPEGYGEHVEQAIACRLADDPVSSVIESVPGVPAGEQLDAERRGERSGFCDPCPDHEACATGIGAPEC